ncbi:hypothetical protein DFH07DRAFT_1034361 [Mycena maculata]|uniref:NAD(P)-binding domain-containing protein n=1 Tax=Mycena maculata TaxID=230809 RepID=A0AAD7IW04_9AGAR|nr:hypothetical protein DFH07DRAFT_1034361 [Mycena maculata]
MRLFLTAGLEVLRTANADPSITHIVTVLVRNALPANDRRHKDFGVYPAELVKGHDACVWALGRSTSGTTEVEYTTITYDYPVAAFNAFVANLEPNQPFRFVYFSSDGADPSGKSSLLFARVKRRAETDLLAVSDAAGSAVHAQMLRPGYFSPSDAQDRKRTRSRGSRVLDSVMAPLLRSAPKYIVPIHDLARVALGLANGSLRDEEVLSNTEIRQAANKIPGHDKL